MTPDFHPLDLFQIPGQEMRFTLERTANAIERDGEDRTFSLEAVEDIALKVQQWILSRLWRRQRFNNFSPHEMEVEVRVKLDGEAVDVVTVPFTIRSIDGSNRWEAIRGKR